MLFQLLRNLVQLSCIFFTLSVSAGPYHISLRLENSSSAKVKILGFYGAENFLINTYSVKSGALSFYIPEESFYQGFYRLQINDTLIYDFVAARHDSLLVTMDPEKFHESLKIGWSHDNMLLLDLKKDLYELNRQVLILEQMPAQDSLTNSIVAKSVGQLRAEKNRVISHYCSRFKNRVFITLSSMNKEFIHSQGESRIDTYFKTFDLADSATIRTNLFPQKIIDFFAFFTNLDEASFRSGTDLLLKKASVNRANYNYTLYFLLRLFGEVGPEVIFQYVLSEHYLQNSCDLEIKDDDLKKQINHFVSLMPGNKIPVLEGKNLKGKQLKFQDEIKKYDKTILFFWNPECHFCKEIIPFLVSRHAQLLKSGVNIISFVIAIDKSVWKASSQQYGIPWTDVSDLKGWDSPVTKKFMITKTPFFITINRNGIIERFDISSDVLMNQYQ
jgi:hypothetical protein